MSFLRFLLTVALRSAFRLLCRVDYGGSLERLPERGPFILASNHINFLDIPLLYTSLYPRRLFGLAKRETWKNPVFGFILRVWGAIPVDRGRTDVEAMKKAERVLASGGALAITPEGTRSGDGRLRGGKPGAIALAVRSGAAVIPVGHAGLERFWANFRRLRRTPISVRIGEPFLIDAGKEGLGRRQRAEATEEVMREIARLLPEENRGAYASPDPASVPRRYLRPLG